MAEQDLITMKLVSRDGAVASLQGEIKPGVDVRLFVLMAHDALRMAESKNVTTADLRHAKEVLASHLAEWGVISSQIHLPTPGG